MKWQNKTTGAVVEYEGTLAGDWKPVAAFKTGKADAPKSAVKKTARKANTKKDT